MIGFLSIDYYQMIFYSIIAYFYLWNFLLYSLQKLITMSNGYVLL